MNEWQIKKGTDLKLSPELQGRKFFCVYLQKWYLKLNQDLKTRRIFKIDVTVVQGH